MLYFAEQPHLTRRWGQISDFCLRLCSKLSRKHKLDQWLKSEWKRTESIDQNTIQRDNKITVIKTAFKWDLNEFKTIINYVSEYC